MGFTHRTNSYGARRPRPGHLRHRLFTQRVCLLHSRLAHFIYSGTSYQIATGSGDDTIRIWDMRSLKALYTIPAHTSNVSDVRFFRHHEMYSSKPDAPEDDVVMEEAAAPDSTQAPTTSAAEEWHLRSGLYLASAGYDGFVKLWSADDWHMLRTFPTDSGKVMSVDLSPDGQLLASGTYTRNFQLFAPEEVPT